MAMELIKLGADKQPGPLIENYDNLIWAERFNSVDDFQLLTGDVRFMDIMPEGTLLSLRDSNVVMQVEDINPIRKKNAPVQYKFTGRSWESILDRRVAISAVSAGISDWNVVVKTPSDAAYFIIVKICVDGILDAADIFPSTEVQFPTPADYLTSTGPTRQFSIPKGNLLTAVLQLLQTEAKADPTTTPPTPAVVQHGIRAVRPNSAGAAVAIQIYTGQDRPNVYFDGTRDLLDDGQYLFSKRGSASTAYILGQTQAAKLNKSSTAPTGFDRRVILVDGTTSGLSDPDALQAHGEMSLAQAKETAIFDGSINQDLSPYVYGVDYDLGDTVRLVGDYGIDQNVRVTEFIRSIDKEKGYKAYPTLTTIDD